MQAQLVFPMQPSPCTHIGASAWMGWSNASEVSCKRKRNHWSCLTCKLIAIPQFSIQWSNVGTVHCSRKQQQTAYDLICNLTSSNWQIRSFLENGFANRWRNLAYVQHKQNMYSYSYVATLYNTHTIQQYLYNIQ